MPIKNPKELFVALLSHVRHGTERSAAIYKELGDAAQNPEIQEALAARAFVSEQTLAKQDEAFKKIQSPEAERLLVLAKANHPSHKRTAEPVTLVTASGVSGHHGVGVLLETCLADHLAFVERTKRLIGRVIEARIAARAAS